MTRAGPQVQAYKLTVCRASGFAGAPLKVLLRAPKFFLTVQDGNVTLVQTATSERTFTPEWNTVHDLSVLPTQLLKFELFRDSSVRNAQSIGSFEATMGELEQLQAEGKLITRRLSGGITLTLRCQHIELGPGPAPQTQPVPEPALAPQTRAGLEVQAEPEGQPSPRGLTLGPESRLQTDLKLAPEAPQQIEPSYGAGLHTFALTIGIDDYTSENKPRLQGATNDARNMHQLLRTYFGVPESHIRFLYNKDATRSRILEEFKALSTNKDIQKGDAIIIYFAGHGSRAPAPPKWRATGNEVETICPVDEEFAGGPSEIHGIPDRTIAALVHNISVAKGENIVLIFDCCHSGGIARGDAPKQAWRSAQTTSKIPEDLDEDIWGQLPLSRGGSKKTAFLPSLSNYVLLAACRPHEQAMETLIDGKSYGAFSTVLFRHLRRSGCTTTYSELLRNVARDLEGGNQKPVVEGERKDRPIFDGLAARRDGKQLTLTAQGKGSYTVDVGTVHGITAGCRFRLHRSDPTTGAIVEVGVLAAKTVSIGSSILQTIAGPTTFDFTTDFTAVIDDWGTSDDLLDIHFGTLNDRWRKPPTTRSRYRTTAARSKRTLVLHETKDGQIAFERGSPVVEYMKELLVPPITLTPLTLQRTLNAIGDFHFHLGRNNPLVSPKLKGKVKLGIHKLDDGASAQDLFSSDGRVTVNPGTDFFFTITNDSPFDVYPYLFFFDSTEYSIQDWYSPPQQNGLAPLPASVGPPSFLRVGFYDSAFEFSVPEKGTRDLGFVKLFVSTSELDMQSLIQDSPFVLPDVISVGEAAGPAGSNGAARAGKRKILPKEPDSWDAACYTLDIQLPA